jgi:cytochrome c-type biogenesis protein
VDNVTLIAAVLAGAASFLSPCVLPLLPGYLSLMSGYSMQELAGGEVSLWRVARSTLLFIAGFSAVFVLLFGAAATSLGRALAGPGFRTVSGILIIAMGIFIAVTAIWNPTFLLPVMRERRVEVKPSRLGAFAPPVMGAAFAFGWTPCVGPFLTAALTLGANSETMGRGMLVLFFYSLGLGVPFLVASVGLAGAFSFFDRLKKYLTPISVVSGLLLAGFGVLLLTGRITDLNAWFSDLLIRLGLENLAEV